ncbi:hypothetical protein TCON_2702 [Astathelohania contejeani]|uniref:Uncharacterized protein n=1 Tax=Astathelohania contejeani TaxID=164912 RepID=A0ABQ7HV94_9MICR|nr:hypothetical protein TCON_2702 [Thelohania contejeani]
MDDDDDNYKAGVFALISCGIASVFYYFGYRLFFYLIGFPYVYLWLFILTKFFFMLAEFCYFTIMPFFCCDPFLKAFRVLLFSFGEFIMTLISVFLGNCGRFHVQQEAGFTTNLISFFICSPHSIVLLLLVIPLYIKDERKQQLTTTIIGVPFALFDHYFSTLYAGISYYFFYSYYTNVAVWPIVLALIPTMIAYPFFFRFHKKCEMYEMACPTTFIYKKWILANIYHIFLLLNYFWPGKKVAIN